MSLQREKQGSNINIKISLARQPDQKNDQNQSIERCSDYEMNKKAIQQLENIFNLRRESIFKMKELKQQVNELLKQDEDDQLLSYDPVTKTQVSKSHTGNLRSRINPKQLFESFLGICEKEQKQFLIEKAAMQRLRFFEKYPHHPSEIVKIDNELKYIRPNQKDLHKSEASAKIHNLLNLQRDEFQMQKFITQQAFSKQLFSVCGPQQDQREQEKEEKLKESFLNVESIVLTSINKSPCFKKKQKKIFQPFQEDKIFEDNLNPNKQKLNNEESKEDISYLFNLISFPENSSNLIHASSSIISSKISPKYQNKANLIFTPKDSNNDQSFPFSSPSSLHNKQNNIFYCQEGEQTINKMREQKLDPLEEMPGFFNLGNKKKWYGADIKFDKDQQKKNSQNLSLEQNSHFSSQQNILPRIKTQDYQSQKKAYLEKVFQNLIKANTQINQTIKSYQSQINSFILSKRSNSLTFSQNQSKESSNLQQDSEIQRNSMNAQKNWIDQMLKKKRYNEDNDEIEKEQQLLRKRFKSPSNELRSISKKNNETPLSSLNQKSFSSDKFKQQFYRNNTPEISELRKKTKLNTLLFDCQFEEEEPSSPIPKPFNILQSKKIQIEKLQKIVRIREKAHVADTSLCLQGVGKDSSQNNLEDSKLSNSKERIKLSPSKLTFRNYRFGMQVCDSFNYSKKMDQSGIYQNINDRFTKLVIDNSTHQKLSEKQIQISDISLLKNKRSTLVEDITQMKSINREINNLVNQGGYSASSSRLTQLIDRSIKAPKFKIRPSIISRDIWEESGILEGEKRGRYKKNQFNFIED